MKYWCECWCRLSPTLAHAYHSWGDRLHGYRHLVASILRRLPVSYSTDFSTLASGHGHCETSQVCLCRSYDNVGAPSLSERVCCDHACPVDRHLSWISSQVVLFYRYRDVCPQGRC